MIRFGDSYLFTELIAIKMMVLTPVQKTRFVNNKEVAKKYLREIIHRQTRTRLSYL